MRLAVEGVGLRGPGLDGWAASQPVLAGAKAYEPSPIQAPPSTLLPPNERRRAVQTVRMALAAGAEAFAAARRDPAGTATIFTSSGGDGETIHEILSVLTSADRDVSPTRFHNSVHNAPAGYWSIATGARAPSSSLCCHDDSFAAGLLEAAAQVVVEQRAVALIAYDVCYPRPLGMVRPIGAPFAVALILAPAPAEAAFADLAISLGSPAAPSVMPAPELETLRENTPAARALPLLGALGRLEPAEVVLNYLGDMALTLQVMPTRQITGGVQV